MPDEQIEKLSIPSLEAVKDSLPPELSDQRDWLEAHIQAWLLERQQRLDGEAENVALEAKIEALEAERDRLAVQVEALVEALGEAIAHLERETTTLKTERDDARRQLGMILYLTKAPSTQAVVDGYLERDRLAVQVGRAEKLAEEVKKITRRHIAWGSDRPCDCSLCRALAACDEAMR